nr:PREDICTED: plasminogen [Latimeria chalumnae]|eukprot:XP_014341332.1 PREDICTED: plasminogen [Latimeria chalumnae]
MFFLFRSFLFIVKEQSCRTLPINSKFMEVIRRRDTALYEKKIYLSECRRGTGTNYRGTISKTKSGITCQRWRSTVPHNPNITPSTHPDGGLEGNYCRNPDGDTNGPWCYTTDKNMRWEHCDIPLCEDECMHCSGENYRGQTSITESGYECQRWDSQTPHSHGYRPHFFPDKYLEENYCRNPDGEPRPWCFTTSSSKRWDFCSIRRCSTQPPSTVPKLECLAGNGDTYRGDLAVTVSGKECQRWDAQSPHKHLRTPDNYPCKGLDANYCRNPDGETMPWCYTINPATRWEYCKVTNCDSGSVQEPGLSIPEEPVIDCYEGNGADYRGTTARTVSGKKCQRWNSMTPHKHTKTPGSFPNAGLQVNYCRNPDGDRQPWCYTIDPEVRWEYCNLRKCILPQAAENDNQKPVPKPTIAGQEPSIPECINGRGENYRGKISKTSSGKTCQEWSSTVPHSHTSFYPTTHPNAGLDKNYCRNPDGDINGPWCYTTDPNLKWENCDIPKCEVSTSCGKPKTEPKKCPGRIVGGCVSRPYSWPWQISLRTRSNGCQCHYEKKLTLLFLFRSSRPAAYKVVLGIHREHGNEPSRQERDVISILKGPNRSDIALLKLNRPVTLTDQVLPICLPAKNYMLPSGAECYVTGWGDTKGTGGEGYLKETGFPVIENKVCNRPEFLNGRVSNNELCAGNIHGGADSCQGDSGGPLVCYDEEKYIIQGVTSWGLGCAEPMKPGVYVRVSSFISWIEQTMENN